MIKGIKKTTLLVAGVVVTSIVPNKAAEASVQLEALEGTMESIYSYNGTYAFKGCKGDSDDSSSSVYYFNGENDIKIEDTCSDDGEKYGSKYVDFKDDEMLFNLESGLEENDDGEDKQALVESKFKISRVKKAAKYETSPKMVFQQKVKNSSWGNELFEYKVESVDGKESYLTFLSEDSEGLDASVKLNIIHFPKDENGQYLFDENNEITSIGISKYSKLEGNGYKIDDEKTIFADSEYIYRIVKIKSLDENKPYDTGNYIEKISREKGSLSDGVYQPNSTTGYFIDDEYAEDFWNEDNIFVTKNNSVYVGVLDDDELTLKKYDFKNTKQSRSDRRVVDFDNDERVSGVQATSIDNKGNLWILAKGKIEKLENGEFKTIYTADRGFDKISVYDDNNLSVWSSDKEIYSIVSKKENTEADKKEDTEEKDTNSVKETKDENVSVSITKNEEINGSKETKTNEFGWANKNGLWYYIEKDGNMKKGWLKDNNLWYYLQADGSMKTGWFKDIDETWYYLKEDGSMALNENIDGYHLGENGAWVK